MSEPSAIDDPAATVAALRARRSEGSRRRYRPSRLDRHRSELVALRAEGATLAELAEWLRYERRVRVARSTIHRALLRWEAEDA